jgi:hypothetical protein
MNCTDDDVDNRETDQADEPTWWQEVLRLGDGEASADPLPEADWAAFFTSDVPTAEAGEFGGMGPVAGAEIGAGAPVRQGRSSRQRQTYTPEKLDEIRTMLLALPARDPAERRLDKQTAIRHIVDEITALQQRGYTLEQVAGLLTDEGIEVTTPTLKNYLQRIRNAGGTRRKKPRSRATMPLVLRGSTR